MKVPYLGMSAVQSADNRFRFRLSRYLSMGDRTVVFVGLNPSTADANNDDPTIRKCAGFARLWGFNHLVMVNIYAWRATRPKDLLAQMERDIAVPQNEEEVRIATDTADLVIAAWGATKLRLKGQALANTVACLPHTRVLRFTEKTQKPEHPLYVPYCEESALKRFTEVE